MERGGGGGDSGWRGVGEEGIVDGEGWRENIVRRG